MNLLCDIDVNVLSSCVIVQVSFLFFTNNSLLQEDTGFEADAQFFSACIVFLFLKFV